MRETVLGCLVVGSLAACLTFPSITVCADPPPSRLSQLMLNKATMYLPARLLVGEENRFIFKGTPGHKVVLYISPKGEGYTLPNGTSLKVGEDFEKLEGTIPEKGVLELMLPMPDDEDWLGHYLYVDAVSWGQEDFSDLQPFQMMDAAGRRTAVNALEIGKTGTKSGLTVMPALPGMPTGAMQSLTQMSDIVTSGDDRRKQLLDDGTRDRDNLLDRNTFINRPGIQPAIK